MLYVSNTAGEPMGLGAVIQLADASSDRAELESSARFLRAVMAGHSHIHGDRSGSGAAGKDCTDFSSRVRWVTETGAGRPEQLQNPKEDPSGKAYLQAFVDEALARL